MDSQIGTDLLTKTERFKMKNKINFSMIFIINMILCLSINMNAQPSATEPCLPDCPSDVWVPAFPAQGNITEVTVCTYNGQDYTAQVVWRVRYACNQYHDYYIELINTSDFGASTPCHQGMSSAEVINDIILKFLVLNPGQFPPLQNGDPCKNNWRVMKGGCWTYDCITGMSGTYTNEVIPNNTEQTIYYPFDAFFKPCATTECCLEYFTVCIVNGVRTITNTGYQEPQDCTGQYSGCVPTCGSIYNR